jgi:thioredoxin 1
MKNCCSINRIHLLALGVFLVLNIWQPVNTWAQGNAQTNPSYKVTFIELGSVRCVPCIKMQSVIKSIEDKYGSEVKVVFHDVWTPEGKEAAKKYTFNVIPTTQLFLDKDGKEYFRHEDYFPEDELIKVLKQKGVK